MLRQHRLDFFAQQAGQNRRAAAGRDRDHQRRTIDNRRHNGAGLLRRVHQITEDTARFGGLRDLLIHRVVIGGGDHQPALIQPGVLERARNQRQLAAIGPLLERRGKAQCADMQIGAGGQQQPRFALGDIAAAYQQTALALQATKKGKVVHSAS